jgi:DNA-binding beta-propeller fold protein YncE
MVRTGLRASGVAAGLAIMVWAGLASATETPRFQVDAFWPKPLPNNWILGQVASITVDPDDNVWVLHRPRTLTPDEKGATLDPPMSICCVPAPPVIEFDPAGKVIRAWGGPGQGYDWPSNEHGLRVDEKGYVWLGGNGATDGMVLKFTRDGKFVMQIGRAAARTSDADTSQLAKPADIWLDYAANEVYIADGYGNHRVIVFDATTGAFKRLWGAYGKPPAPGLDVVEPGKPSGYDPKAPPSPNFSNPVHCVKIADDGLVYVCDRINNRIQIFHKDGSFVREWVYLKNTLGSGSTWDVALWPDRAQSFLLNADGTNNQIRILRRSDGTVIGSFGRSGRNAGQFHWVHSIAIDSKGNVYTAEVDNGKRVQKFRVVSGAPRK